MHRMPPAQRGKCTGTQVWLQKVECIIHTSSIPRLFKLRQNGRAPAAYLTHPKTTGTRKADRDFVAERSRILLSMLP